MHGGYRCPECGSTEAGPDESRSRVDFTYMECRACGYGGLFDSWQREDDWRPPAGGCGRCDGPDPARAWQAARARSICALLEESHFSVRITACACGQRHAIVFTERIDWQGGEDDQLWLVLPISAAELEELATCDFDAVPAVLTRIGAGRRFLVRSFPPGGQVALWWRDAGFAIGPHD